MTKNIFTTITIPRYAPSVRLLSFMVLVRVYSVCVHAKAPPMPNAMGNARTSSFRTGSTPRNGNMRSRGGPGDVPEGATAGPGRRPGQATGGGGGASGASGAGAGSGRGRTASPDQGGGKGGGQGGGKGQGMSGGRSKQVGRDGNGSQAKLERSLKSSSTNSGVNTNLSGGSTYWDWLGLPQNLRRALLGWITKELGGRASDGSGGAAVGGGGLGAGGMAMICEGLRLIMLGEPGLIRDSNNGPSSDEPSSTGMGMGMGMGVGMDDLPDTSAAYTSLAEKCLDNFGARNAEVAANLSGYGDGGSMKKKRGSKKGTSSMLRHMDLLSMPIHVPEVLGALCSLLAHEQVEARVRSDSMQELMILLGPNNTCNNRERILDEPMWQYDLLKVVIYSEPHSSLSFEMLTHIRLPQLANHHHTHTAVPLLRYSPL